jgi:hypothetical protein
VIERDGKTIVITGWRAWVTANGFLTTLPAVAPVQGSAQPSYNNQDSLPGFNKTLIIADKLEPLPALYLSHGRLGPCDRERSQQGGPGESGLCGFRECVIFRLPGRLPDRCGSFRGCNGANSSLVCLHAPNLASTQESVSR